MKNLNAPLTVIPELDTSCRQDVLNSVYQLQIWTGNDAELRDLSISELLELQTKLEQELIDCED
jgi:hypothetical protein